MKTTWLINKEFSNFYKFPWTLWDNPYTDLFSLFSIVLDTKANKTKPANSVNRWIAHLDIFIDVKQKCTRVRAVHNSKPMLMMIAFHKTHFIKDDCKCKGSIAQ